MRKALRVLVPIAVFLLQIKSYALFNEKNNKRNPKKAEAIVGEFLVKLKAESRGLTGGRSMGHEFYDQAHNLQVKLSQNPSLSATTFEPLSLDPQFVQITLKDQSGLASYQLQNRLEQMAEVEYVEPNYIYRAEWKRTLPNDTDFSQAWGMFNVGQIDKAKHPGKAGSDIGATKAWSYSTGSKNVVVAVIDTGIDLTHPELVNNIFTNTAENPNDRNDNDNNGFVDDVHGWSFVKNNNNPNDENGHGTHCAGVIGAEGNNKKGVAGVNWNASILPIQFLNAEGSGKLTWAISSILYAAKMKANVISASWGGGGYSKALKEVIEKTREQGMLFVAAAGNEANNNDETPSYPASYDVTNIISVAALNNQDVRPYWSNYGKTSVHLAAPGVNIYSTVPVAMGGYDTFSGTSMATPHVAGAAALLWSVYPEMNYGQIKQRLMLTVDPVISLEKKTIAGGRLNVYNAITNYQPTHISVDDMLWTKVNKAIESEHPYKPSTKKVYMVAQPGAHQVRLHFNQINLEQGYDLLQIRDKNNNVVEEISGKYTDYYSDFVSGDTLYLYFVSDNINQDWGFSVDQYEYTD